MKNNIYLVNFCPSFCLVKISGATDPVAVIEVVSISRNMRLQWVKCKVISNNTSKPLFGPSSTKTRSLPDNSDPPDNDGRVESMSLADLGARGRQSDRTGSRSEGSTPLDNGIVDIKNWSALLSRTGSGRSEVMQIKDRNLRKEWCTFHDLQSMGSDQERSLRRRSHFFHNTHSSEGGGLLQEQQEFSLYDATAARSGLFSRPLDMSVDVPHFKGLPTSGGATLADDKGDQNMETDGSKNKRTKDAEMKVVNRTVSVFSSIDGGSSDSGELQALMPLCPLRTTGLKQQDTTTSLSMATEPGPTIDIIFSNLFNHSTLKVAERVEIHEPCRRVALFGSGSADCVWIVERYVVGWQKKAL